MSLAQKRNAPPCTMSDATPRARGNSDAFHKDDEGGDTLTGPSSAALATRRRTAQTSAKSADGCTATACSAGWMGSIAQHDITRYTPATIRRIPTRENNTSAMAGPRGRAPCDATDALLVDAFVDVLVAVGVATGSGAAAASVTPTPDVLSADELSRWDGSDGTSDGGAEGSGGLAATQAAATPRGSDLTDFISWGTCDREMEEDGRG